MIESQDIQELTNESVRLQGEIEVLAKRRQIVEGLIRLVKQSKSRIGVTLRTTVPEDVYALSVREARLSQRIITMFEKAAITVLGDLEQHSWDSISQMSGIGITSIQEMKSRFEEYGIEMSGQLPQRD
jgi:DNA-directed RNA polymerase alpha subunit